MCLGKDLPSITLGDVFYDIETNAIFSDEPTTRFA